MRPQLIEPGEEIPVRLTTRQRDLILEHTFIEPELEKRLRIAVTEGASIVVGLSHSESSPGYAGEAVKVQQFQE